MRYLRRSAERLRGGELSDAAAGSMSPVTAPKAAVEMEEGDREGSSVTMAAAAEQLRALRRQAAVRAMAQMGDYLESLGPIIHVS